MRTFTSTTLFLLLATAVAGCSSSSDKGEAATTSPDNGEARVRIASTFDTDNEEWLIVGDAQGVDILPTHVPLQEGMSAHIVATDDAAGGVWYFSAPLSFTGDLLEFYAGTLDFDLKTSTVENPFEAEDVVLISGGAEISTQLPRLPDASFTRFSIPLSESGWTDADDNPVDVNTFSDVLANVDGLLIRGEYNTGPDTGGLDNVVLAIAGQ